MVAILPKKKKGWALLLLGTLFLASVAYALISHRLSRSATPPVEPQTVEPEQEPEPAPQVEEAEESSLIEKVEEILFPDKPAPQSPYALHKNINTTYFWAGEEAGDENKDISNLPSAWDEQWVKHYGGIDSPKKRKGYFPAGFTPKENPFYFALPYNDFDRKGKRKAEAYNVVPWAQSRVWKDNESMLKNQWIKIIKGDKVVYAQWEDVGPFKENDAAYVFGGARPQSKTNKHAGLDVSPAVRDFLGLSDLTPVDWQFIPASDVPDGPWKQIVTTSQISWK